MGYKVGDMVVYPRHGAAKVEAITERTVKGITREYLQLSVLSSDGLVINVPVDNAKKVGVRDIVDANEVAKVFEILRTPIIEKEMNWSRRYKLNVEKIATGDVNKIADDMLSTTLLACRCKKLVAPAMNTNMYENPITQANLQKLRDFGMEVIEPATGLLACKAVGKGKMPSEEVLLSHILQEIQYEHDMEGKRVLITAGPTREAIDPVRYLTNHSTGKMGYALAKTAARRGAKVTLVSGPCELPAPLHVDVVPVESAADMFEAVKTRAKEQDIIIKAAAVADYTPITVNTEKTKKKEGEASIALKRTTDILSWLGEHKEKGQFLCGFSMETENMLENSKKKLEKKHADMIVANNLKVAGAGFGTDTNVVTLITKEGAKELPIQTKDEVSYEILNEIMNKMA